MNTENLEKLGLSPNESKIYLALLDIGSSTADKISQKAGIHRRTIYDNIEKLLNKGLISYSIRSSKKYFEAADPNRLKDIISEKKQKIENQEKILKDILPELLIAQKYSKDKQEVNVYKGKEGIKTILWDILRTGKPNCVIGAHSSEEFRDMLALFHKERIKLKIKNRMIFKRDDIKRALRFSKLPYTEVRIMPTEYGSPIAINIYGDKIGLLIRSVRNPLGVMIKNKDTADGFRAYFEVLWNSCEK
ncbi:MAG: helix-turn-helix domain-containing protein [archaeon]